MIIDEFRVIGSLGTSRVLVGEKLENFRYYTGQNSVVVITDENVAGFYGDYFGHFPVIVLKPGEKSKTLNTVNDIYKKLLKLNCDRNTFILGVGGGIVCDIAGFAASTFLRGMHFGFVSTSLLSQVDASVGGKNGVNYRGYKNLVGTFSQPDFVICDPRTLVTLPKEEISGGFAEIIKHTLIADWQMFAYLEENIMKALNLNMEVIQKLTAHSISVKTAIVNRDEREKGDRKLLNFGHTLGHAIEKISGISHGQAVAIGMVMASEFSAEMGFLSHEKVIRIKNLLTKFNLPVHTTIEPGKLLAAIQKDKKRNDQKISFIFLKNVGEAVIQELEINQINKMLNQLHQT